MSSFSMHGSSQRNLGEKELLEFYQKQLNELLRNDDKYREKVDKHIKELVADRYELEAEVIRRGEKISDLQRALVDLQLSCFEEKERYLKVFAENEQLKRNEEKLHENIRHLLNGTKDKDLRDRIIYVLKDPNVDVCYSENQFENLGSDAFSPNKATDDFIKEQIQSLQDKLDEHSHISRNKSDVILEDCKQALEKSRERLSSNEAEFRKLQRKLHQTEAELSATKQTCSELREFIEKLETSPSPCDPYPFNNLFRQTKYNSGTSQANQQAENYQPSYDSSRRAKYDHLPYQEKEQLSTQQTNQSNNTLGKSKSNHATLSLENLSSGRTNVKSVDNPLFPSFASDKSKPKPFNAVVSNASNMHLSLVMLSKILTKLLSTLNDLQSTEVFVETANLPKEKAKGAKYVSETSISQFQSHIRQCTRLTFDIKNIWKQLEKSIKCAKDRTQFQSLESDLAELESAVDELAVTTTEVDLISISLSRATFFNYLTGPKQSFEKFGVKEINNHSKYVSDVKKMEDNLKVSKDFNMKAVQIMEKVIRKCNETSPKRVFTSEIRMNNCGETTENPRYMFKVPSSSKEELSGKENLMSTDLPSALYDGARKETGRKRATSKDRSANMSQDVSTSKSQDYGEIYEKHVHFGQKLGMTQGFPMSASDSSRNADRTDDINQFRTDDVMRKINKTLSKIHNLESGEHFKDKEFCKHFGEQINTLTEKLKTLYEEFNVKSLHQQFAEYSSVTFGKLETLAKQSRDAVITAEAQISVQRSNAKQLSYKLRNTEDLLRESIDECLLLKQKLQILGIKNETEKLKFRDHLRNRLDEVQDFDDLETAVKEVVSSIEPKEPAKKQPSGPDICLQCKQGTGHQTCDEKIRQVILSVELPKRQPSGPYECLYCKQGTGHKSCEEKIKELRTNNRKLSTENKLLQQEIKEEKKFCKMSSDEKNQIIRESTAQINILKEYVQTLEARNASLMEQLKVDKNRLKKMERFRHLEIEGFQTDIKNLKTKIQDMEKQLVKAVSIFGNERKDMEFLETIHNTTEHSKQAASAIRRLKAKLYELERDFKHL